MDINCCEDDSMKLWQKIFIPSMVFTMIGIFAISLGLIVRNHTLELDAEKERVLLKNNEVRTLLEQTMEEQARGDLISCSAMNSFLNEVCESMGSEDLEVVIRLVEETKDIETHSTLLLEKESGCIQYQGYIYLSGNVCEIRITNPISSLLEQFQEDIGVVRSSGIIVSLVVSFVLLVLSIVITRPIQNLKEATEKIAAGDYTYRITYQGKDELSDLARYMNHMIVQIEANRDYIEGISENRRIFIANMTHELKTPLTSILGFADVLRIKTNMSEEEKKMYADIIFTEASRLRKLSSSLMELITMDETEIYKTPLNVRELIAREIQMYQPICKEADVELSTELESFMVLADETLLATLVVNLLDNARKASKAGQQIQIICKRNGDKGIIQIRDEGIGIPKEQLSHVTEVFYMVDKARTRKDGGAGIGLSLCKAIVKAHQGELGIESEEGAGTTVSVYLPLFEG